MNSIDQTGRSLYTLKASVMAQSHGTTISVKVPIAWEQMTKRSKQRLQQIVGRDTRIIKTFLGVIQEHEPILLTGKKKLRINENQLHKLTMTATRGKANRPSDEHDMKTRVPRSSQNEITECRKTAVSQYESYLALRNKKGRSASHPCEKSRTNRIPRWIFSPNMFRLVQRKTSIPRWWMDLRDSLDSASGNYSRHDRLMIPLKISPFHENQLNRGELKAAQVFADRHRKWWVTFAIRLSEIKPPAKELPKAVLGVDLGISKAACTVLVTPRKVSETRFYKQEDKIKLMKRYDNLVAELQHEMDTRRNSGQRYDNVAKKLRRLKTKRENISREHDRVLVRQLLDYIVQLSEKYTLYVAIGRLKGIRNIARRGNYKGRRFRSMINSWAFARITDSLKHQLAQLGWVVDGSKARFRAVPEQWTSIMCWKCGSRRHRPKQNLFVCPNCGQKTNADRNGAINIAGRLITLTESLQSVKGLGKWAASAQAGRSLRLKARRKSQSSQGKSSLSKRDDISHLGESAAVHHVQTDLLSSGDGVEMGDDDPAAGRTVEILSAAGSDIPASMQEKETKFVGGISSR